MSDQFADTILRKDPLLIAIDEIRVSRLEEKGEKLIGMRGREKIVEKQEEENYLAAIYHYEKAVNFIRLAYPRIQLGENRIKLDRKLQQLNEKIEILTMKHDERERSRLEARMKEEAKTKYSVIGPINSLDPETFTYFQSVKEEKTIPFDENLISFVKKPFIEDPKLHLVNNEADEFDDDDDFSDDDSDDENENGKEAEIEKKRPKIMEPMLIYGPSKVGKTYFLKNSLPFELQEATFVTIDAEDISIYGPILFTHAYTFAREHMPVVVILENMEHQVYQLQGNTNSVIHETLRSFIMSNTDIQVLGISSSPWDMNPTLQELFTLKILMEHPNSEQTKAFLESSFKNMSHSLSSNAFDLLTQEIEMLEWTANDLLTLIDRCQAKCEQLEQECEQVKQDNPKASEEEMESLLRPHLFTLSVAKVQLKEVHEQKTDEVEKRKFMIPYFRYQRENSMEEFAGF